VDPRSQERADARLLRFDGLLLGSLRLDGFCLDGFCRRARLLRLAGCCRRDPGQLGPHHLQRGVQDSGLLGRQDDPEHGVAVVVVGPGGAHPPGRQLGILGVLADLAGASDAADQPLELPGGRAARRLDPALLVVRGRDAGDGTAMSVGRRASPAATRPDQVTIWSASWSFDTLEKSSMARR